MAERGTPDLNFESGPVHSGIGSKIGYRHHQTRRSAFITDAKGKLHSSARGKAKKLAPRLGDVKLGEPLTTRIFTNLKPKFVGPANIRVNQRLALTCSVDGSPAG